MPLDPERVQALFLAAAELADPTERAPFLDRECANNPELRRRLLVLLKAHDDSGNLPPADDLTGAFKPAAAILKGALSAGQVFAGRYKLREKLGEGGMGEVWVADQSEPVQRRIALKVIKTGLDSARLLARFEQERQALALMDHPNIAKVLDAGVSDDGQSYFVMELVKGLSLTKYCDDARLSPKERLELFIPVCQAVQHAHQKGIIHRDLKPSNILIGLYDGRPVPKVIDFGVAKATGPRLSEQSIYTEVGALVGTLEYMSPEQAELNNLDIDTRADIYSLGVVLYELLTGSPPFTRQQLRSAAFTEMLRIIREVEPPKPSARLSSSDLLPSIAAKRKLEPQRLTRLVHGDLDWIVMKCLEKDRGRRYETANGLALDVLRYLHEEPVLAGPPSARYRLRKFVRRNRGPVLAAAGSAALVLLGIGGLIAGLVALEAEQRHTKEALQQVRVEQRHTAEALDQVQREQAKTQEALLAETAAKAQARKALDILTDDVVEKVFAKQPVLGETEKGFLRNVLKFYEQFTQELGDTPDARELRASGHFRVALIRYRLGQAADAETANRDALAIRKQLAADFPTVVPYRKDLATSYNNLGALLVATGRAREAETAYRDAVGIQKQLAADFPTATAYRYDLAGSQSNLGLLLANTGRPKEAETAYRDALAIQKLLATDFPTVPAYRHELARCHSNLGVLFADTGRPKEAETAFRDALAIKKQLAADFLTVPAYRDDLARSHNDLGVLLSATGRPKEAETAYRDALAIQKQLAADFPSVAAYRHQLAGIHNNRANLLVAMGRPREAETAYRDALAIQKQLAADFPSVTAYRHELASSQNNLGILLSATGRPREAETAYRDALAIQKQLAADFPSVLTYRQYLARRHRNLGLLLAETGRPTEAETAYRDALAIQKQLAADFPSVPTYREELASSHNNLGLLLAATGRPKEAETAYRDAIAIRKQLAADFHTMPDYENGLAGSLVNLGRLLHQRKDEQGARRFLEQALPHHQAALRANPRNPAYREFFRNNCWHRAEVLAAQGDHAACAATVEEWVQIRYEPANDAYNAACVLAGCVPLAEKDPKLTESKRKETSQAYAERAMALLRHAVAEGYNDAAHMKVDTDLDPLRGRKDFQALMAKLEKK